MVSAFQQGRRMFVKLQGNQPSIFLGSRTGCMIGSKFARASSPSNGCAVSSSKACERWIATRTSSRGLSDVVGDRAGAEHIAHHPRRASASRRQTAVPCPDVDVDHVRFGKHLRSPCPHSRCRPVARGRHVAPQGPRANAAGKALPHSSTRLQAAAPPTSDHLAAQIRHG